MRNRHPVILRAVRKSLILSGIIVVVFFILFLVYLQIFIYIVTLAIRSIEKEVAWRKFCKKAKPAIRGDFCKGLYKEWVEFSLLGAILHNLILFAAFALIFHICTQLILDLEKKSQIFRNWWRHAIVVIPPLLKQATTGG